MKRILNIWTLLTVILIGFTACQKSTKDQLVGTWKFNESVTVDGVHTSISGTEVNKNDGTNSYHYTGETSSTTDIDGTNVIMKIGFNMIGNSDWTVNGSEIVSSPTSCEMKVTSVRYYDPSDNSFIAELTGSDLEEFSKVFTNEMESDMLEASTERIIMLQKDKYVTEATGEDGKKTTSTYHRVK